MREVRSLEWALECGRRGWLSFPLVWFTKKPTKDSNGLYQHDRGPGSHPRDVERNRQGEHQGTAAVSPSTSSTSTPTTVDSTH